MKYLITGAGQIGTQIAQDLLAAGHEVTVLRRSTHPLPGTKTISADAGDAPAVLAAAQGAAAIFHCVHSSYDAKAWARDLPPREQAAMDAAAQLDIPVVFPESVYAFGRGAQSLAEGAPLAPASPLGNMRAQLLTARKAHRARTISVVAADLVGPTANPKTSVFSLMILDPLRAGKKSVWVMGSTRAPRTVSYIPDLSRSMVFAAQHAADLAPEGDAVLNLPSSEPLSQQQIALDAAASVGGQAPRAHSIPNLVFHAAGLFQPMMRELAHQHYLWANPAIVEPGILATEYHLAATPWQDVLNEWARQAD